MSRMPVGPKVKPKQQRAPLKVSAESKQKMLSSIIHTLQKQKPKRKLSDWADKAAGS